jgi:hypothetical protein
MLLIPATCSGYRCGTTLNAFCSNVTCRTYCRSAMSRVQDTSSSSPSGYPQDGRCQQSHWGQRDRVKTFAVVLAQHRNRRTGHTPRDSFLKIRQLLDPGDWPGAIAGPTDAFNGVRNGSFGVPSSQFPFVGVSESGLAGSSSCRWQGGHHAAGPAGPDQADPARHELLATARISSLRDIVTAGNINGQPRRITWTTMS